MQLPEAVRQQLAQQQDTPAYRFFREHAGLPEAIRNTAPPQFRNSFTSWVWLTLLPFLRLKRVWSESAEIEGRTYYQLHIHQPFRHYHVRVTPFLAAMFGNALSMLSRQLTNQKADLMLAGDESIGELVVPTWAVRDVLREFRNIIEENKESVQHLLDEVHRLQHVETDDETAVPKETRTLH